VHISCGLIVNGVSVRWRGWLDLERLDGVATVHFDEQLAQVRFEALRLTKV
jgi:hypothetical protein